jgi:hypothetical protein
MNVKSMNRFGKKTYWIIGGGAFGLRAAESLRRLEGLTGIVIVEHRPERCRLLSRKGFSVACEDGVDFMARHLDAPAPNLWIVAAAPVHVAFEWMLARLSPTVRVQLLPVPEAIASLLPNATRGRHGEIYASNADFLCPPDCLEAGRVCTATGRARPCSMHAFIQRLPVTNVKILVIRSFQLAAGVGGLRPRDLISALDQARKSKTPILLATACRCHAVLNSFSISTA